MSFDYANTDPDRRRNRARSRLAPTIIGLAIVVLVAIALRKLEPQTERDGRVNFPPAASPTGTADAAQIRFDPPSTPR